MRIPFLTKHFSAGIACLLCCAASGAAEVTILFIGARDGPAHRGARQGLVEAQAQGEFLGLHYALQVVTPEAPVPADTRAIVVAAPAATVEAVAAAHAGLPVFNPAVGDDDLRRHCRPNLFHTLPSHAMLEAAQAQWATANPGGPAARAQAWHPDFTRYAAAQLNKRYRETFGEPLTDEAWAAWAAVKLIADTVARLPDAGAPEFLAALHADDLAFDGQKGADLSFRPDGQLRQPLLLTVAGQLVGEAPLRGVASIDDLDSLGRAECPP